MYEYDCRTPWTQIEAPQQVIFSNNPLDFLTAIKDSYNTSKRRNTWSTQFSHTRNALQLPERAVNCPPLQVDRALKTHNITKQLHNVTCPRQHIHQFYLAMSLFYLAFADHFACWQLLSSLKVSQDLIDVLFVMQISMVPTTKTNSCNTDLFLETWLYCLSNPSQVEDVRNCAKYVEKKCLQSNLLKDKTGCELQRMEKIWKNGVPLSIPLRSCTSSYVELLVFLRTLVIPDNAYLKVSSFYPSSLQRISALEEFSIPSRKKTKPKFSGFFHLKVELQSSRAQEAFLCKPIFWQWSEVYSGVKNTSYWYKDKRNYCNSDSYLCSPQNILIGLSVVVVSLNPTTFCWPSR